MSGILPVGGFSPPLTNDRLVPGYAVHRAFPDPDAEGGVALPRFSDALLRIVEQSSWRHARALAIRAEIEDGAYETPERISGTVDRLLDVIA